MTVYVIEGDKLVVKRDSLVRRIQIMRDIQPYKSMVDGTQITSRSHHRQHLRDHNCIEVGNEKMESKPYQPTQAQRDARKRMLYQQFENVKG